MRPVPLYHFTCEHRAMLIDENGGFLVPAFQPFLDTALLWLTIDGRASAAHLGMASHEIITCDRMEARYRVDDPIDARPWNEVRREFDPRVIKLLEQAHGARPSFWYVAHSRQIAVRDDR